MDCFDHKFEKNLGSSSRNHRHRNSVGGYRCHKDKFVPRNCRSGPLMTWIYTVKVSVITEICIGIYLFLACALNMLELFHSPSYSLKFFKTYLFLTITATYNIKFNDYSAKWWRTQLKTSEKKFREHQTCLSTVFRREFLIVVTDILRLTRKWLTFFRTFFRRYNKIYNVSEKNSFTVDGTGYVVVI